MFPENDESVVRFVALARTMLVPVTQSFMGRMPSLLLNGFFDFFSPFIARFTSKKVALTLDSSSLYGVNSKGY